MNSVVLMGRVSNIFKAQEYGKGKDKTKVLSFKLATYRTSEVSDFIMLKAFNGTADVIEEYVNVGDQILIQGRIQTGQYENEDGDTVYTTDIIADRVEFGAKKADKAEKGGKKGR